MITITYSTEQGMQIEGFDGAQVTETGHAFGLVSRLQAQRCEVHTQDNVAVCTVTGHMFGNQPFFVVESSELTQSVKLSQEMEQLLICYKVSGGGFSLQGDFSKGRFDILHEGSPVAALHIENQSEHGCVVHIDNPAHQFSQTLLGLGIASLMMVHKLAPQPSV
ncbi:hypothetical protein KPC83_03340 [Collinsella sp. zg1085]|uniref:hypothetical protein n=1 Tax=Collinsella sp. zg1085 TaxID=2844380 RepID=UPI001C0B839A|nr:hypothetical protein [Collinsella sp. zg1085]QWT18177.1 hypothetical protein KPC83_03340 [Collinsella sp. zg1085]